MNRWICYLLLIIGCSFRTTALAQDLGELEFEQMPSSGIIVDDPSTSLLVIESTVKSLQFRSRAGVRKVDEPFTGVFHVFLNPGVHIVEILAEDFLPLKLPRINFRPKGAQKFRVRAKTIFGAGKSIFGAADRFNVERPRLRINYTPNSGEEIYVKLDDNPPQKVDFTAGYITMRPNPGDHVVQVYVDSRVWEQRFAIEARGQYEATVQPSTSSSGTLDLEQPGNMFVDSKPQGATVLLNQVEQKGQTPLTIYDIQPGNYQVDILLPQHQTAQRQVEVQSLEFAQAVVDLVPTYGELIIESEPTGSIIYIGNEQIGTTPYRARRAAGLYLMRLVQSLYHDQVDTLSIEVGAVIDTTYIMRPRYGQLFIQSNPSGAEITLDGQVIGVTPLSEGSIPSGNRMLEVSLDPYQTIRRSVTIADGKTDTLMFDLLNTVGRLQVNSNPSGARVAIKETGRELGFTPLSDVEIFEGGYTLVLSLAKHDSLERPVQVQRRKDAVLEVDMVRQTGMIRIESTPPQARIIVNGEDYGQTPQVIRDLPTDTYRVRLELENYDPSEANIVVVKDRMADHIVEMSTDGIQAWQKRKERSRLFAMLPGMGLGQLIGPGQRLRGLLYSIGMGGALAMAYTSDKGYAQARVDYDTALQSYTSAFRQEDIDRHYDASVDASNRMNARADQFKLALTGAGLVYAVQLIDALLFGGGDIEVKQTAVLKPVLQISEKTPSVRLQWQF